MLVVVGVVRAMVVISTIAPTTPTTTKVHKPINLIVSHLIVIFAVVIHHHHSIMPVSVIRPPAVVSVWQASDTESHYDIQSLLFIFFLGNCYYYSIMSLKVRIKAYRIRISGGFNPRKHTRGVNTPQLPNDPHHTLRNGSYEKSL